MPHKLHRCLCTPASTELQAEVSARPTLRALTIVAGCLSLASDCTSSSVSCPSYFFLSEETLDSFFRACART